MTVSDEVAVAVKLECSILFTREFTPPSASNPITTGLSPCLALPTFRLDKAASALPKLDGTRAIQSLRQLDSQSCKA